ncbi:MG406 family protein [[Acholeplasma] multilocale]|uniref:MG406 family protein n=1 Tax=[Acholeplasma] multilocale TaxID=264638 RepID=UPI00047A3BC1|nr:MG406 family protein [[Acholeplasma] multilocale]
MSIEKQVKKVIKPGVKVILGFSIISLISLIVLVVLVGTKTIGWNSFMKDSEESFNYGWNWISGWVLGELVVLISAFIILKAVKFLVKYENHIFYFFMYVLRVGLYGIPFLLAFLIPSHPFHFGGILIGLIPLVILPYLNGFLLKKEVKNN